MTPVEDQQLLDRWCPKLRYDSMAVFFAVSVKAMLDAPGNSAMRGDRVLASTSDLPPLLSEDWLRRSAAGDGAEPAKSTDRIVQAGDRVQVAQRFQADPS